MAKHRKVSDKKYSATINGRYRALKAASSLRKLPLLISKEEFKKLLTDANCFFCKDKIDLSEGSGYCLDRINNSKGYYLNNVVTCCKKCNEIKGHALNFEESIFVIEALKIFRKKFVKRN